MTLMAGHAPDFALVDERTSVGHSRAQSEEDAHSDQSAVNLGHVRSPSELLFR